MATVGCCQSPNFVGVRAKQCSVVMAEICGDDKFAGNAED